jgi:hypothetical protein
MNAGAARELCVPLGENGAADARVAGRKAASSRGLRDGEPLARIPSRTAVERSKRLRDAETASLRSRMTCRHDLIGDR